MLRCPPFGFVVFCAWTSRYNEVIPKVVRNVRLRTLARCKRGDKRNATRSIPIDEVFDLPFPMTQILGT